MAIFAILLVAARLYVVRVKFSSNTNGERLVGGTPSPMPSIFQSTSTQEFAYQSPTLGFKPGHVTTIGRSADQNTVSVCCNSI